MPVIQQIRLRKLPPHQHQEDRFPDTRRCLIRANKLTTCAPLITRINLGSHGGRFGGDTIPHPAGGLHPNNNKHRSSITGSFRFFTTIIREISCKLCQIKTISSMFALSLMSFSWTWNCCGKSTDFSSNIL